MKHRRTLKKVATDEISDVPIQTLGNLTFKPEPLVLWGSPVECNIDVQWELCIVLYQLIHTSLPILFQWR